MRTRLRTALAAGLIAAALPSAGQAQIRYGGSPAQLLVDGKPFLILGGDLGSSSAGTAAQADAILPRLAAQHFNTVLVPVARR
jgi:hypothetical protein